MEICGYTVRRLTREDVSAVYALCASNPQFYGYHPPFVTRESIEADMTALPPGKTAEDKYFAGFFGENGLAAVMDLILGFPDAETTFIGFFMTDAAVQRRGVGSRIIAACAESLVSHGFQKLRLAVDRGNPQSLAFWTKNGFYLTGEEFPRGDSAVLAMERTLRRGKAGIEEIPVEGLEEFWREHIEYLVRDGIITDEEDIEYFRGEEYRGILKNHMLREKNRHRMLWFTRNGVRIGAASFCTYQNGDGQCFIMDFWVFPPYRGGGAGHDCFAALEAFAKADGAVYFELNSEKPESVRFWRSLGFRPDGEDEYGMPLFRKEQ